jgi:excisionase family DNA binding protein
MLRRAVMSSLILTLAEVQEELAISASQVYALVRHGDLPAVKLGGRGQWRVERAKLEDFIAGLYHDTAEFVRDNPYPGRSETEPDDAGPTG